MAVTKIIPVRVRLDHCVDYVMNPDKTTLKTVLKYTGNSEKTEECLYITAFNCDKNNAYSEMIQTQKRWGKSEHKNSVLAYHLIQAFPKGKSTPDEVHEIGKEFVEKYLADKYEVVMTTHIDKEHLHNHIIFNSVSFMDGKKYRNNFKDYFIDIRGISDMVCKNHEQPVITPKGKGLNYAEWDANKSNKATIRGMLRNEVNEIIKNSYTFKTFIELLQERGYSVKYGERVKYIAVRPPGSMKYIRLKSLGDHYTEENISLRIKAQRNGIKALDNTYRATIPIKKYKIAGGILNKLRPKKITGFVALYLRYMYMLGKVKRRKAPEKVSFLLREEVIKFERYRKQFRFLHSNNIKTHSQLNSALEEAKVNLDELILKRENLYTQKKGADNEEDKNKIQKEVSEVNSKLQEKRKFIKMCGSIKTDASAISKKMHKTAAEEDTKKANQIKGAEKDEHKWGSSRFNG